MELSKKTLDVRLVTSDLARARLFYAELLGFPISPPTPQERAADTMRLKVGGHELQLVQEPEAEPDEGGVVGARGMRLLAFILDDLDAVLARFDSVAVPYQHLPLPDRLPFCVAFSSDPDGNALELVGLKRPAGDAFAERLQIGLTVGDIARTQRFYSELLGFPLQPEMPLPSSMGVVGNVRYAVTAGATTIKFWKIGDGLPSASGAPEECTGIRLMRARVPDLAACRAELSALGIPVRDVPQTGGAPAGVISDPDGNWIELLQGA